MKTAMALLVGRPDCGCVDAGCGHELEWVAKRAREEMREAAATAMAGRFVEVNLPVKYLDEVKNVIDQYVAIIRALPVGVAP